MDRLQEIKSENFTASDTLWLIVEVERLRAERASAMNEATRLHNRLTHIHSALSKEMPSAALLPDDLGTLLTAVLHQRRGAMTELGEVHDILAEGLGYQKAPTLEEDPDCPCPGDYVTGDHTAASLALEAAKHLRGRGVIRNADLAQQLDTAKKRLEDNRAARENYEQAIDNAVGQIIELQQELAEIRGTRKAVLRREIEALRFKCCCPYNIEGDYLARAADCPTHGDEASEARLAAEKALNTLKYVRKYFMGSEHGHEV